jgi:YHS domain-containing protein
MEEETRLSERILARLELHRKELTEKQQQLEEKMKGLLEQKDRLAVGAKRRIEAVILPMMQELMQHFDNGKVEVQQSDDYFGCVCEFAHTPRFPATVRFGIAILPGNESCYTARSDLNILPVLMEYNRNNEAFFPLEGDNETLAAWAEDRILEFVDTYLRLETHPLYQKDNAVIDIVCGMHIPFIAATSSVMRDGRTFYFCSEHCKEAFIKGSN